MASPQQHRDTTLSTLQIYLSDLSLNVILGGKNCNSTMLFMRLRVMQNPNQTPSINVNNVTKITAINNTSNTVPSIVGNPFIHANKLSIMHLLESLLI